MSKLLSLMLVLAAVASGITTSGWYRLTDLKVDDAPSHKTNGDRWDAMAANADLMLSLSSNMGDGASDVFTTYVLDEAGTSGRWDISEDVPIYCASSLDGYNLLFVLTDHDTRNHDEMDRGWVDAADLSTRGVNEVRLQRGTIVSFELTLVDEVEDGMFWGGGSSTSQSTYSDSENTIRPGIILQLAESGRTRPIESSELDGLSYREIKLLRNTFYAFYNRPFSTDWISVFFLENLPGYTGNGSSSPVLSEIEASNVNFILEYEEENEIPAL